jgi:hypothetical protein
MNSFCVWEGETLVLNILGKPGAKQDAIGKAKGNQLKISVTASPVAACRSMLLKLCLAASISINSYALNRPGICPLSSANICRKRKKIPDNAFRQNAAKARRALTLS